MDSPKQSSAALRYFFARFKPLAQPKWWVPSGLIVLGGICVWQYWSHPEWLGATLFQSQPQSATPDLEAPAGNLLDDPLERLAVDLPGINSAQPLQNNPLSLPPASPLNPLASPSSNPLNQGNSEKTPANNPLSQLTQPLATQGKSQLAPIFTPLIPSFKDTPAPTAAELLKPTASSPSLGQISAPLPTISVTNNPLQEAMQQLPATAESGIQTEPPRLERQQVSQPQPVNPTYSPPYYNYGGQPAPTSPTPYYNAQPPAATPPAPYYNTQPPAATWQQPYANPNYGYGSQPVTPNQPSQPNSNQQPQSSPFNARIYRSY